MRRVAMLQDFAILIAEKRIWDVEFKLFDIHFDDCKNVCCNDSIDPNSDQSFQKPGIKARIFCLQRLSEKDRTEAQL